MTVRGRQSFCVVTPYPHSSSDPAGCNSFPQTIPPTAEKRSHLCHRPKVLGTLQSLPHPQSQGIHLRSGVADTALHRVNTTACRSIPVAPGMVHRQLTRGCLGYPRHKALTTVLNQNLLGFLSHKGCSQHCTDQHPMPKRL